MTAPLDITSPISHNGTAPSSPADDKELEKNQESHEPEYTRWDWLRIRITGYRASFLLTGYMMPIVASATVVALYFSNGELIQRLAPFVPFDLHSTWLLLLLAHVLTIVL
jgi:hypothetical protein